jgi:hypothetical protein
MRMQQTSTPGAVSMSDAAGAWRGALGGSAASAASTSRCEVEVNTGVRSSDYCCNVCGEHLGGLTLAERFTHISKCAKRSRDRQKQRNPARTPSIAAAFLRAQGMGCPRRALRTHV